MILKGAVQEAWSLEASEMPFESAPLNIREAYILYKQDRHEEAIRKVQESIHCFFSDDFVENPQEIMEIYEDLSALRYNVVKLHYSKGIFPAVDLVFAFDFPIRKGYSVDEIRAWQSRNQTQLVNGVQFEWKFPDQADDTYLYLRERNAIYLQLGNV